MLDGYKKTEAQIKQYREAALLTRQIIPVIKKFDKKVFNKRLQDALQAETSNRVYCNKRYTLFEIFIYNSTYNQITLCNIQQAEAFTDGKRIDAAAVIAGLNKKYTELLKLAQDLELALAEIETTKKALELYKDKIDQLTKGLPYQIRDNFDINYRVTRH